MTTIKMRRLTTRRLLLRPVRLSDAKNIFRSYGADPAVTKYLSWRTNETVDQVRHAIRTIMLAGLRKGTNFPWVITKRDGELIGMIELRPSQAPGQGHVVEVGYVLSQAEWGRGYMTEALKAVLSFGFGHKHVHRMWAYCNVANKGSARVMEKAGMKKEGTFRRYVVHPNVSSIPCDCHCYSKCR